MGWWWWHSEDWWCDKHKEEHLPLVCFFALCNFHCVLPFMYTKVKMGEKSERNFTEGGAKLWEIRVCRRIKWVFPRTLSLEIVSSLLEKSMCKGPRRILARKRDYFMDSGSPVSHRVGEKDPAHPLTNILHHLWREDRNSSTRERTVIIMLFSWLVGTMEILQTALQTPPKKTDCTG